MIGSPKAPGFAGDTYSGVQHLVKAFLGMPLTIVSFVVLGPFFSLERSERNRNGQEADQVRG
jgi:hypothetical protein